MRSKSPELMKEICEYAEQYYLQNRQSPSTTKIAEAVGVSIGTAYKYLVAMNFSRPFICHKIYEWILLHLK